MTEYATMIRCFQLSLLAALFLGFGCGEDASTEGSEASGNFGDSVNVTAPVGVEPPAPGSVNDVDNADDPRFQLPDSTAPSSDGSATSTDPDTAGPTLDDTGGASDPDGADEDVTGPPPSQGDVFVEPTDPSLAVQPLAGVCSEGEDCETADCNTFYPGGYCTVWCTSTSDCPEGAKCYKDPQSDEKMCWKGCESPDDCRIDQFCAGGVCTPKCVRFSGRGRAERCARYRKRSRSWSGRAYITRRGGTCAP